MSQLDEYNIHNKYILYNFQPSSNTIKEEITQLESLNTFNYLDNDTNLDSLNQNDKEYIYSFLKENNSFTKKYLVFAKSDSFIVYNVSNNATSLSDSSNDTK